MEKLFNFKKKKFKKNAFFITNLAVKMVFLNVLNVNFRSNFPFFRFQLKIAQNFHFSIEILN